jgi:hypothetical protein
VRRPFQDLSKGIGLDFPLVAIKSVSERGQARLQYLISGIDKESILSKGPRPLPRILASDS